MEHINKILILSLKVCCCKPKSNFQTFDEQYQNIMESTSLRSEAISEKSKLLQLKDNLSAYKEPTVWKPAVVLFLLFVFQQFSAGYVIIFYALDIFRQIGGSFKHIGLIDEFVALILLGGIRFVMAVVLAAISNRTGRRVLMFVSAIGMIVTSFTLGLYMYLTRLNVEANHNEPDGTVAVILVLTYVCFSSFGWLVIPWTLIGELLPVKVRGVLGGFMVSVAYGMMFVNVKVAPFVMQAVRLEFIFLGLSVVNVCGLVFIYLFLPETLGKTFSDIANYFTRKSRLDD